MIALRLRKFGAAKMADKRFCVRRDGQDVRFSSADDAFAFMSAVADGETVLVEIVSTSPRNVSRHRLYWALCSLVSDNHETLTTREAVSDALKIMAGHFEPAQIKLPGGDSLWLRMPKSISFAKMAEADFGEYLNTCFDLIGSQLLPGVDVDELRKEAYTRSGVAQP